LANVNAPNGFQYFGRLEGGSPTAGLTKALVSSGDTSSLGYGDAVTSLVGGYVTKSSAGTTQIAGIFYGCSYVSIALQKRVYTNFYGGADAAGDVTVHLCTDPDAIFVAQSDNTAFTQGAVGNNTNLVTGTASATTQMSAMAVAQSLIATTNTLPFRIVALYSSVAPPGANGADDTTAYNRVLVSPNNWDRKSLIGI